jgi:hypothetical protein
VLGDHPELWGRRDQVGVDGLRADDEGHGLGHGRGELVGPLGATGALPDEPATGRLDDVDGLR